MTDSIHSCSYCHTKNKVASERLEQAICGVCGNPIVATYYKILNVARSSAADEIKKAYRKLALQWHPDSNKLPYAEEVFKSVNEAYSVLYSPEQRKAYDNQLNDGGQRSQRSPRPHMDEATAAQMFIDEMYQLGMELAFQNTRSRDIRPELITRGCPPNIATVIAQHCETYRKSIVRKAVRKPFIFGLIGFVVVGLLTRSFFAAMIFGGYGMVKALYHLLTGNVPKDKIKPTQTHSA